MLIAVAGLSHAGAPLALREPTLRLKLHAHDGAGKPFADGLRELFGLDEADAH